jgi:hypothetical protein
MAWEGYRRKIEEQFFTARGLGKLKLTEARKASRDCPQRHRAICCETGLAGE